LAVFDAATARLLHTRDEPGAIAAELWAAGVLFERWRANAMLDADASDEVILRAYGDSVQRLKTRYGFAAADVIAVRPDHPQRQQLRSKFLDEHTHSEFEVRFFVDGRGLFFIHRDDKVYAILCEKGDLLSVPAGFTHWFDMGEAPSLRCIRLFTSAEGWVAEYTGDPIAARFPSFDDFLELTR
jgi:1,2-dihydroxy-3-keto-5-methylthiopentene dioxygenase